MLDQSRIEFADVPTETRPLLVVVVDTEEEFDWSRPLSRENTSVTSLDAQRRAQEIFARYGVVPTYVVDYPVAVEEKAVRVLSEFLADAVGEIGAHLHPWVNPPHEEAVTPYNSYAGNLPAELERAKLECLTETIEASFGLRPTIYRAGRFGVGPATAGILEDLGYRVDASIVPRTSFAADGGPNFNGFAAKPYWFGRRGKLLELPVTAGFAGALAGWGPWAFPALIGALGMKLHAPGVAARLGLLERIRLTPEGGDYAALRRLTRSLLGQGCRIFSLTYHSPSLEPGRTPYVRDRNDLRGFLETMDRYLDAFVNDLGGRPTTITELYRLLAEVRETSGRAAKSAAERADSAQPSAPAGS
ncbi:MAG: polysaccharide deacetylase family protein [Kiloniellaceae bacterium]